MTYAIVKTGGKQYRVEEGQTLLVERLRADAGAKVPLEPLLYRGDKDVLDGADLAKVKVERADEKSVAEVHGSARIIRVNEGRISGKQMPDGRWATHEFFYGDALVNLQTVQGKLAYQILYEQDDKLPYSERSIVEQATKVPPKAFEALVKARMTDNREKKLAYLTNAMREYEKANPGSVFKEAAFELGHLYYSPPDPRTLPDYKKAAEYFSMLQRRDPHYAESAFYASLAYWRAGELQSALDVILPLTSDVPLTSIYNNAGALSTQAARAEKNADKHAGLLKQAANFLSRAADSEPDDPMVRFNYAYALMLSGKYAEAAEQLKEALKQHPKDPEALFLLAQRRGDTRFCLREIGIRLAHLRDQGRR